MRRTRRTYSRQITLPIAPIAGLAAGMYSVVLNASQGNYEQAMADAIWHYTGMNIKAANMWQPEGLKYGLLPLVAGLVVHKVVGGTLGANRMLARAGVPVIRI